MKIYSSLPNDHAFNVYTSKGGSGAVDVNLHDVSILVSGGAGIQDRDSLKALSRDWVATEVTKEQLEELKKIYAFNDYVKKGFIMLAEPKDKAPKRSKSHPITKEEIKKNVQTAKLKEHNLEEE